MSELQLLCVPQELVPLCCPTLHLVLVPSVQLASLQEGTGGGRSVSYKHQLLLGDGVPAAQLAYCAAVGLITAQRLPLSHPQPRPPPTHTYTAMDCACYCVLPHLPAKVTLSTVAAAAMLSCYRCAVRGSSCGPSSLACMRATRAPLLAGPIPAASGPQTVPLPALRLHVLHGHPPSASACVPAALLTVGTHPHAAAGALTDTAPRCLAAVGPAAAVCPTLMGEWQVRWVSV
jgi:hypothetical protein